MTEKILECRSLKKHFQVKKGIFSRSGDAVHAVDGVDFYIEKGETFGLVGESGCGKSTIGLVILRLLEPTMGEVYFEGENIFKLNKNELREKRRDMQMVFQDIESSLDPKMTINSILSEPLEIHGINKGSEKKEIVLELLRTVGLKSEQLSRTPDKLSQGQRQRIAVARVLAVNPKFIVLDEPTSALDMSVQAKILNLLNDLKKNRNFSYLFITHDLSVISNVSERTAVMYLGKIIELATTKELFESPQHPYTQALFSAIPGTNPRRRRLNERTILKGDVPSPVNLPSGCRFHNRCGFSRSICEKIEPELINIGLGHSVACHLA